MHHKALAAMRSNVLRWRGAGCVALRSLLVIRSIADLLNGFAKGGETISGVTFAVTLVEQE